MTAQFVFLFGKKMGVNLGQQLVKVSKRGKMKALTPTVDRGVFREERLVKIKMTYKDGVFTVRCNGRKTAEKKVKANDVRGHFGMLAKDVRLQITNLSIKGLVDTGKL